MTDDCKTFTDYQTAALRTSRGPDGTLPPMWYLALGMTGEAGEVANLVKKFERHGKPFDPDAVVNELGDVLWYVTIAAVKCGVDLAEVAQRNVAKLRRRYADGFEPAGGGADADRAAAEKREDHFADADKMVADHSGGATDMTAPVTGEHPAPPAPRPQDDGVRCGKWGEWDLEYSNGKRAASVEQCGLDFKVTLWAFPFDAEAKTVCKHRDTKADVKLAAEAWLRARHPYFDREWPGRWDNPPKAEVTP